MFIFLMTEDAAFTRYHIWLQRITIFSLNYFISETPSIPTALPYACPLRSKPHLGKWNLFSGKRL